MLVFLMFLYGVCICKADVGQRTEVVCPALENEDGEDRQLVSVSRISSSTRSSSDDYCLCSLTEHGTKRTAILKCDFKLEQDIILKDTLFPFKHFNVTSAYVRMKNARSATISAEFLSSWMDAPSSALDLWHCGKVVIEPTPTLHELQQFTELNTFVGVGIINCSLDNLPALFLRDRSRGAFRLKGCVVGRINAGLFHNIQEIRYMNIEDTIVEEVAGPLSSSGVITLSKKEIHSWDGIEFINSTFNHIAPFSFNVTHKNIMEKFNVRQTTFGRLEKGAITATGDINVSVNNCSFSELESLAIQISVNGDIAFANNVIEAYVKDSLLGLNCKKNSDVSNIIFYVDSTQHDSGSPQFNEQCGKPPEVSYIEMKPWARKGVSPVNSSVVSVVVLLGLCFAIGAFIWGWKNWSLQRYFYRRSDTPLWKEERTPDGEEDSSNQENSPTNIVHNPTFANPKLKY